MLPVLGSASTALIKSGYRLTGKGGAARTSTQPGSELRTASVCPQFLHLYQLSTPTSAPSWGQIRRAGSARPDPRTLGMFPLRLLLLATWSIWFPRAHTAVWHTFLAAVSHPVAGDGDTVVAQTDCPATTLLDARSVPGTDLTNPGTSEPPESRIQTGEYPRELLVQPADRQSRGGHWADAGKKQLTYRVRHHRPGFKSPPNPSSK